jgi:membrane protease YdiL (CAAX protease family)
MNFIARIFLDDDGKLRFIWRALIFILLFQYAVTPLAFLAAAHLARAWRIPENLSAASIGFEEGVNLLSALICTLPFMLYERVGLGAYGLPLARAVGTRTWEGFAAGIVMAGAVAAGMFALGGMQIHGFAIGGAALAWSGLAWLGANVLVGFAEEMWFRAYFLQSLWKSLGFWPAAIVIAIYFAALHYFFKQGENIWDVITLVSISMMLCFSVKRTGALWFAIGFHIAFDFMQFFVIGTPNGNLIPQGRMLDVTFDGPAWLTGGVLGTEASWLMYPMIALVWLYIAVRYRPETSPS